MPTIRQRLAQLFRPRPQQPHSKRYNIGGFGASYGGTQHPLLKSLENAYGGDPTVDPRRHLELYRKIYAVLTPVQRAIATKWVLVGEPHWQTGNDSLDAVLNGWAKAVPVFSRSGSDFAYGTGLAQFYRIYGSNRDVNGMAFAVDQFDDAEKYQGIRMLNSADVTVQDDGGSEFFQWEQGGHTLRFDPASPYHSIFVRDFRPEYAWGLPAIWGTETFATSAIRTIISNTNARVRFGNPLGLNFIDFDTEKLMQYTSAMPHGQGESFVQEKIKAISSTLRKGLRSLDTSHVNEVVAALPGGKFTHQVYGQGMKPMDGAIPEIEFYLTHIIIKLGIPAEFSGIFLSGGGLGSDKWAILRGIMQAGIAQEQDEIRADAVARASTFLTSQRLRFDPRVLADGLTFTVPDVDDAKLQAETESIQAATVSQQLLNYSDIQNLVGTAAADEYAADIGRDDWMQ